MRRQFAVLGIVLLLLIGISAAETGETMLSAIDAEYRAGQINFDEAMLYKAYVVCDHSLLPVRFQNLIPPRSGGHVLAEIWNNLDIVSQSARKTLMYLLSRPTGLSETYSTTHYKVHYTNTGGDAVPNPGFVTDMADAYEDSWDFLVTDRGYYAPPSDGTAGGDSKYDIYIFNLDPGIMGYTAPEVTIPSTPWYDATSYIAMRNDYSGYSWYPTQLMQATAVHEAFHSVQFAYDASESPWFMEVSSVWIEDEAYPTYDYEYDFMPYFFNDPEITITLYNGTHEYGSFHWATYLSETFGDTVMREIWLENRYSSCVTSFQSVLAGHGGSRSGAFAEFFTWNYFTGSRNISGLYPEGADYPEISIERTHNSYPAGGIPTNQPEHLASNYIVFNIPGGASGPFSITFDGEDGHSWIAHAIIQNATSYSAFPISLNSFGYGSVTIDSTDWMGHTKIIFVVGNVSTSGGAATYTYNADFAEVGPSYNPPRNLVAESGHTGTVPLTWDPPIGGGTGGTEEISHDDGTPAGYIPWDLTGSGFGYLDYEGVRFTAATDCTLKQIDVYFSGLAAISVEFKIAVDNGGIPGTAYPGSPFSASVTPGGWFTVDVPGTGIPIPAGDFHIGYTRISDDMACVCDAAAAGDYSVAHDDLDNWLTVPGDYLLRAQVATGSTGPTVAEYRVHRGTIPGTYSFIGTSGTESYDDGTVTDGTAYYYVVSATYSDMGESGYSNEAMAVPGSAGTPGDTLSHDDGDAEYILTGTALSEEYAVVFEPTAPCQLLSLRYYVAGTPYLTYFGVGCYRWTGTRISESYFEAFPYWVEPGSDGWTEVDITSLDVYVPGDFAASFVVIDTSAHIGIDDVDDDYSWVYDPGYDNWFDLSYTLFIQAVVRYLGGDETYSLSGIVSLSPGTGGSPPPTNLSGSIVRLLETSDCDTTDSLGYYEIDSIAPGVYTVEAWHPGYETQRITMGINSDDIYNFTLIPYSTPLNPINGLSAVSYLDGEALLRWAPPMGYPGTSENLSYYDPYSPTVYYLNDLGVGDIFDTRFEVWFPCTVNTVGFMCYSEGSYPSISLHFYPDDGDGYPEIGSDLADSIVVPTEAWSDWTLVDVSDCDLSLWPGQVMHVTVRLLSNNPSLLASDSLPNYDPPVSRFYSASGGAWQSWGEIIVYMNVDYFSGEARLASIEPMFSEKHLPFHYDGDVVASHPLPTPLRRMALAPAAPEGLAQYVVHNAEIESGPYSIVGTVTDPDSCYFLHDGATNSVPQYYYIVANYDHGFSEPSDTVLALPLAWNDTAWVLFVDDDGSCFYIDAPDEGIKIAQMLLSIGVPFNAVDMDPLMYIPYTSLEDYQAVIWNCGILYTDEATVADSEAANIALYLDGGGKYALFSQDYLWDIYGSTSSFSAGDFPYDYLGISSVTHDYWTFAPGSTGAGTFTGYGFADGLTYDLTDAFTNWSIYADDLMGFLGDTLLHLDVGAAPGVIATQYDGAGFQSVFMPCSPFAMEDGSPPNTMQEFIRRLLYDYFDVHHPGTVDTVVASYDLSGGWHMLSVPVELGDNTADAVFPGNLGVYSYNPATGYYSPATTIEPCIGYFVLFPSTVSFNLSGEPIESYERDLAPGWHMIGVPWDVSGTILFSEASYDPAYLYTDYYGYNPMTGMYFIETDAEVTKAYWAAVLDNCTLTFPAGGLLMASTMPAASRKYGSYPPPPPGMNMLPEKFAVAAPHPNPFNSRCDIQITLPEDDEVTFEVADISGRVLLMETNRLTSGNHTLSWNGADNIGNDAPSGLYFIRINTYGETFIRSVLLVR